MEELQGKKTYEAANPENAIELVYTGTIREPLLGWRYNHCQETWKAYEDLKEAFRNLCRLQTTEGDDRKVTAKLTLDMRVEEK